MKPLLLPCMIGTCQIKNRFVMTAANLGWCKNGFITAKIVDFYRERARGGVGLMIVGAAGVDPVRVNQTGMMQIYDDRFIDDLRKLTKAVHQEEGKIFLQLMHAGAYARKEEHQGIAAVAPSEYVCPFTEERANGLTTNEIAEIIEYFKEGAIRAKKAGFDGVELIGSAGYLIAEFLSKAVNKRNDVYGGGIENRTKFLLEILDAIRLAVGNDYPVIVRLSGSDFISDGNGPEEAAAVARLIETKADAINVTGGWHESQVPQITYHVPNGMFLYLAKNIKDAVSIPVIGCNRLDVNTATFAVEKNWMDMAGILRGFIADPYLVKKYEKGEEKVIRPCLSCNQECLDAIFSGGGIGCVVNPWVGHEGALSYLVKRKAQNGKILVAGAGISGMVFSIVAAKRGYSVHIWEKTSHYGGAANLVAALPNRELVQSYINYLFEQCIQVGVHFCWRREATEDTVKRALKEGVKKVIFATGSKWEPPNWKMDADATIYSAEECIEIGKQRGVLPGRKIVIIGSNYKAVQTAQFCAQMIKEGEREEYFLERYDPEQIRVVNNIMKWETPMVTLLAPGGKVGGGFGKSTRWMMLKEIKRMGVQMETKVEVKHIKKGQVIYVQDGEEKKIFADMIVVASGWKQGDFTETNNSIGDARKPGRISEAVKDAFYAAITLKEGNDV